MPEWLYQGGKAALLLVSVFGLALFLAAYFNTDFRGEYKARFERDLKKAVVHSQPSWDQVITLAHSHRLSKPMAYIASLNLLRGVLTGDDVELQPFRPVIESYVAAYRATDPFDGLPSETRLHLQRLQDALQEKPHLLEPLTMQLKELVSMHEREQKMQRRYTSWGFGLAVVGLVFAGYAYFYPYSTSPVEKQSNSVPR